MNTVKLKSNVVIDLVLNYLGVESKSIGKLKLKKSLSISADVGNEYLFLDSEKLDFLRGIGINVDVEIENGRVSINTDLPKEDNEGLLDVECEKISALLCEFFRKVLCLSECEYDTEGYVKSDCLAVKITRKDGEDFRLYLNEIDVLENFEMLTFVKPVNSTTAIVEFEY